MKCSAWIIKEWIVPSEPPVLGKDGRERPRLHRAKVAFGTKGIGAKSRDRFCVEWIDPAGKRCREKIRDYGKFGKNRADERCECIATQLARGEYNHKEAITWETAKAKFIAIMLPRKRSERTREEILASLAKFEALAGPKLLDNITTATIDEFATDRLKETTVKKRTISNGTCNKDLRNLRLFFRQLNEWKMIAELPRFKMLDEMPLKKGVYTEGECKAMYAAADAATMPHGVPFTAGLWWRAMMVLLYETGARRGELLALDWSGVDLDRRRLIVNAENSKNRRRKLLHFDDNGLQHLRALKEFGGEGRVFPWRHALARLNSTLARIQRAAGIPPQENLSFHAFRRMVGSTIASRDGIEAASKKLGHSSIRVTEDHYAPEAGEQLAARTAMPRIELPEVARLRIVG